MKLMLLLMPCRRLQRQFVTFSVDKRSIFSKLRIMCNVLLMLWSSWSRFSSMGVHRRWQSRHWSQAQVEVSVAMEPHFWQTMIRSCWSRVRVGVGEMWRQVSGGGAKGKERKGEKKLTNKEQGRQENEKKEKEKKCTILKFDSLLSPNSCH